MSPDRDPRLTPGGEPDDDAPRSIFSATWFRVVVVVLGLAVVGAVTVPYVLDVADPPPTATTAKAPTDAAGARTAATSPPTTAPAPPAATPAPATASATAPQGAGAQPGATTAPVTPAPAKPKEMVVAEAPKGATKAKESEPAETPAAKREPARQEREGAGDRVAAARTTSSVPSDRGEYFVQVGAFKDAETAKRLAARLRERNYPVEESVKQLGSAAADAPRPPVRAPAAGAPDRYDVIVSGGSVTDINTKLSAKGLASEPAGEGVRIRPSLPLRDAVALSKDLGSEGFKVQVRRGGSGSTELAPAVSTSTGPSGQTLYRVRVGGYPDRATAQRVLRELEGSGYQPFIAKGRE